MWCCSLAQLWGVGKGQRAGAVFIFRKEALALRLLGLLISLQAGSVLVAQCPGAQDSHHPQSRRCTQV